MSANLEKLLLQLVSQLNASVKSKDSRKRRREDSDSGSDSDSDERPQKRSKSNPRQYTKSNLNDVLNALL